MGRLSYGFSAIMICGLVLITSLTTAAQSVTELRCRGGDDPLVKLFVIDKLDAHTLSLNFNSSRQPAGAESSGLEPATCSWIDRSVRDDEWRQIHFEVTPEQADSVPAYLKNRNNYWSFFVVNTDRGYFEAKSHKAWTQVASGLELRCRGGSDPLVKLFVIDRLDADTLSLNFNSSKKPAGADGGGLEPGTCSWIDRTVKDDEWRQIHFEVTGEQRDSIPAYLKNRDNYWSFFVVNTDRGFFEATSHKPWYPTKEH
jgi:hypothetical protein